MRKEVDDPYEYLSSGAAWADFCDGLKERGRDLFRDTAPKSPVDVAEGHRYLAHMVRSSFELILEAGDPARPWLFTSLHETMKLGWDNPDNIHTNARLSGEYTYRLSGRRGESPIMSVAVYGGTYASGGSTENFVLLDDFEVGPDGRFELILSATDPGHANWVKLTPKSKTMMIRETFTDRRNQQKADLHIERIDSKEPPPPLSPDYVVGAFYRTLSNIRGTNKVFFDWSDLWKTKPNTFWESDTEAASQQQGVPGQFYSSGYWMMEPDEAIVIDFVPPECEYWAFVLSNYWGASFDYRYRPVDVNMERAIYRKDGSVRLVVAREDPGLPDSNWLDTEEHPEGVWTMRYLHADQNPIPEARVVKTSALASLD